MRAHLPRFRNIVDTPYTCFVGKQSEQGGVRDDSNSWDREFLPHQASTPKQTGEDGPQHGSLKGGKGAADLAHPLKETGKRERDRTQVRDLEKHPPQVGQEICRERSERPRGPLSGASQPQDPYCSLADGRPHLLDPGPAARLEQAQDRGHPVQRPRHHPVGLYGRAHPEAQGALRQAQVPQEVKGRQEAPAEAPGRMVDEERLSRGV